MGSDGFFEDEERFTIDYGSGRSIYADLPDLEVNEDDDDEEARILQVFIIFFVGVAIMVGMLLLIVILDWLKARKSQGNLQESPPEMKTDDFDFSIWDDDGNYWKPGDPQEMDVSSTDEDELLEHPPVNNAAMSVTENNAPQIMAAPAHQEATGRTDVVLKDCAPGISEVQAQKVDDEKQCDNEKLMKTQEECAPEINEGEAKVPKVYAEKKFDKEKLIKRQEDCALEINEGEAKVPKVYAEKKFDKEKLMKTQEDHSTGKMKETVKEEPTKKSDEDNTQNICSGEGRQLIRKRKAM